MRGGAWLFLALGVVGVTALPGDNLRRRNRICSAKHTTKPTTTSHSVVPVHTPCVNCPTDRQCWGDFDINTNYYQNTPDTGVTKEYWLTVDNVTMAPDGFKKIMLVVNNQFPGPTIEANWGDNVVVHVKNNLKDNGTSIHWHGILMEHNNANDGVPGVTQCPIPPGESFTYRFRATSYGTSWYHSHLALQYSDGILGPIVVHGPSSANWDIDLGPVTVSDLFHRTAFQQYFTERIPGPPSPASNGLINGKNKFNGSGEYSEFKFTPGKKHRIRLINTSTNTHFKFWIDQHVMTVQAADFIAIKPYTQTVLNIGIGQRYDIIFEANQAVGNYWMHALPALGCSANNNLNNITAIVRYEGSDKKALPNSTPYVPKDTNCEDETGLVPVVPRNVGKFSGGEQFDVSLIPANGLVKWNINASSFLIDYEDPMLLLVDNHDPKYPSQYNVVSLNGTEETWVYFVIQAAGTLAVNHPIHLHGHDFLLLASGTGTYNDSVLANANLINPIRRDVVTMPAAGFGAPVGGFIVIAFPLDNPGIWLLHCHIAWHVSEGLALQFVERIDEIPGKVGVGKQWQDTCATWKKYEDTVHPPSDGESGV